MKIIPNTEIDRCWYNQLLNDKEVPSIYLQPWYLDVVCPNWKLAEVEKNQLYFMLPERKKLGISYLFEPNFIQQFIPIGNPTAAQVEAFTAALSKSYLHLRYNLGTTAINLAKGLHSEMGLNHVLYLKKEKELSDFSGYNQNTTRNIKKAQKAGVSIVESDEFETTVELFKQDKANSIKLPKDYLTDAVRLFQKAQDVGCYLGFYAKQNNNVLCGAIFLVFQQRAVFIFSGNSSHAKACGAFHFLIHQSICELSKQVNEIDFEGSNKPGLARFYKSFGATEEVYLKLIKKLI